MCSGTSVRLITRSPLEKRSVRPPRLGEPRTNTQSRLAVRPCASDPSEAEPRSTTRSTGTDQLPSANATRTGAYPVMCTLSTSPLAPSPPRLDSGCGARLALAPLASSRGASAPNQTCMGAPVWLTTTSPEGRFPPPDGTACTACDSAAPETARTMSCETVSCNGSIACMRAPPAPRCAVIGQSLKSASAVHTATSEPPPATSSRGWRSRCAVTWQ
mmetsp:Transcript_16804/g.42911  ORF Transcript_16804/g.42911 Transcript_16804/m.42911 type:complete len:216 (-) Transcript_16804:1739-2386(-)